VEGGVSNESFVDAAAAAAEAALAALDAPVHNAEISDGLVRLHNDTRRCVAGPRCEDDCGALGDAAAGLVQCGVGGGCVPRHTCADACADVLGPGFGRCWLGGSEPLGVAVRTVWFSQALDVSLRLPGTVELYSCTNCTSAGAREAFGLGMAAALGHMSIPNLVSLCMVRGAAAPRLLRLSPADARGFVLRAPQHHGGLGYNALLYVCCACDAGMFANRGGSLGR